VWGEDGMGFLVPQLSWAQEIKAFGDKLDKLEKQPTNDHGGV